MLKPPRLSCLLLVVALITPLGCTGDGLCAIPETTACVEIEDSTDWAALRERYVDPDSRFDTCFQTRRVASGMFSGTIDGTHTTLEVDRCAGYVRLRRGSGYVVRWKIQSSSAR